MGVYEQRAVLFLDILGFSELVQAGRANRLLGALEHLQGRALEISEEGKLDFTAFSDCVVVSAPMLDGRGALQVVHYAQFLALDLLAKGFLTRGAIVSGELYHRGSIVLGPALVHAYRLESKKALYPRILVSHSILGAAVEVVERLSAADRRFTTVQPIFREDFDGSLHVDIFSEGASAPEMYSVQTETDGSGQRTAFRDSTLTFIDRIFSVEPPPVATEKYAWLARYFFEKCKDNLWPLPTNLPIPQWKKDQYEEELRVMRIADQQE